MNAVSRPENTASPNARPQRGRWFAALALLAILAAAAFGWLPALITLPAVAILATFIAVDMRSTSHGIPIIRPDPGSPRSNNVGVQLAAIINALPEPTLLVDKRSELLTGNVAAAAIFGRLRLNEPISLTVRNPLIIESLVKAVAGIPQNFEVNERLPIERSLNAHVIPLIFGEEAPELFLFTFRDRTQEKRIEQMRVDFVANASHELRTPLASLSGFIETLQSSARDDPAAREKFLAIMGDQTRRMSRLIDDLMSLSRIELTLHLKPQSKVDLTAIVDRACDALKIGRAHV